MKDLYFFITKDTLAEWLRRRPAKPLGFARVGSNPTGVVTFSFKILFSVLTSFLQGYCN